jgi:hypothetical protein
VLQHMPEKQIVFNAIREMMRILHPSGAFLFQFNGYDRPTMNWKGRVVSGVLDRMSSIGLHRMSRRAAQLLQIDPEMLGKTWRGTALSVAEVEQAVRAGQGAPEGFQESDTPLAWCYGRKQVEA